MERGRERVEGGKWRNKTVKDIRDSGFSFPLYGKAKVHWDDVNLIQSGQI